jgi:hypothetical protein
MKVITYQEGDGVAVVSPAPGMDLEAVIAKDVPPGVSRAVIDRDQLPADRYFRDAWEYDGPRGVKVNVEKAKEVQRNVWRRMRQPKLEALDLEVMKAVERGDAKRRREVSDQKQALRDVTTEPLPDDLDGIRATIPEILL